MKEKKDIGKGRIHVLAYCDSPTCATGFSTVSRNVFEELYKTGRYGIDILGINYWGDPHAFPYRIWPTGTNPDRDPYGRKKVCNMIPQMDFDILFLLQDTFILDFVPELITYLRKNNKKFKSILYYPVDGVPKEQWIKNISYADKVFTYTQYGLEQSKRVYPDAPNIGIIPHGVNTKDYYLLHKNDIKDFKRKYFGHNADKFIFMNVNRNQQRKDIPRTIQAFVEFRKQVPDSVLYLHMAQVDQGWNLPELCKFLNLSITDDVIFPQNFGPNQGYPRQVLNMLYNCVDCVVSTSIGEGWGLCLWPETNIYTEKGIKHISELIVYDRVLSSDGTYNDVEAVVSRNYNDDLYEIITWLSNIPIKSSAEHGFLVFEEDKYLWKKAMDLSVGDVLVFPKKYKEDNILINILEFIKPYLNIRQVKNVVENDSLFKIQSNFKREENFIPKILKITPSLMKLFGLYLAEGSISMTKKDGIAFSFNSNEKNLIEFVKNEMKKVFGLEAHDVTAKNCVDIKTIKFYSSPVHWLFFILFGTGARNKKIHSILLNQSKDNLIKLLLGEFLGDGSNEKSQLTFSTTSKNLAYAVRLLLSRIGILSSVRTSRVEYKITVSGISKENLLKIFNLPFPELDRAHANETCSQNNQYILLPIKSINKSNYNGKLVDIQVANTNDFIAENCVVHNSWIEAMATKTPIIMPANTAIIENITDDKGYLVKSGNDPSHYICFPHDNEILRPLVDVNDMVEKMLHVYNNYDEALQKAENAYNWVTLNMDWHGKIGDTWIKVFDDAYAEYKRDYFSIDEKADKELDRIITSEKF